MSMQFAQLHKFWQALSHFIVPVTCPVCEKIVMADHVRICADCWPDLPFWRQDLVPKPALDDSIGDFYAPFLYTDPISDLIGHFKYGDRPELATALAPFMYQALPDEPRYDAVIAVPMHRKRLHKRQYNQSDLLAAKIAEQLEVSHRYDLLHRVKATAQQQGKTAKQRHHNLAGAFTAGDAGGLQVLLVDDVFTTGTTVTHCAKILKKAGAAKVDVVTLAYVEK